MSIMVMNEVFKRYPEGGGEMLLALAMADHAHDDGTHIWPSIEQLSVKTRQSVRSVQYQLRKMETSGWLILVNSGNGGRNQRREYWINSDWIKGAEIAQLKKDANGDAKGADICPKGADCNAKGCSLLHPHITVPNHPEQSENRKACRLPKTWTLLKSWGDEAMTLQPDWTEEHVRFEADKFRDYWVAKAGKDAAKHDWPATWRNWVRNAGPMPVAKTGAGAAWWSSPESKMAKAREVGVGEPLRGESSKAWEGRIEDAIANGGKPRVRAPAPIVQIRETVAQINADKSGPKKLSDAALQGLQAARGITKKTGP